MPIVTVLGPQAAAILTGAFVVEKIFGIPGMGRFFCEQHHQPRLYPHCRHHPVLWRVFGAGNLVVDLLYGIIDPRIRLAGRKE